MMHITTILVHIWQTRWWCNCCASLWLKQQLPHLWVLASWHYNHPHYPPPPLLLYLLARCSSYLLFLFALPPLSSAPLILFLLLLLLILILLLHLHFLLLLFAPLNHSHHHQHRRCSAMGQVQHNCCCHRRCSVMGQVQHNCCCYRCNSLCLFTYLQAKKDLWQPTQSHLQRVNDIPCHLGNQKWWLLLLFALLFLPQYACCNPESLNLPAATIHKMNKQVDKLCIR